MLHKLFCASVQEANVRVSLLYNLQGGEEEGSDVKKRLIHGKIDGCYKGGVEWCNRLRLTSPSSSTMRRSTPCAAGCCGPKFCKIDKKRYMKQIG